MTRIRLLGRTTPFFPLALLATLAVVITACSGAAATEPTVQNAGFSDEASGSSDAGNVETSQFVEEKPAARVVPVDKIAENGVLASSVGGKNSLLKVRLSGVKGDRIPLKNGGGIQLEDNLIAEIFVDPYPTNTLTAWLDLYLHDGSGNPVTDASVVIDYDMYSMAHGPFFTLAEKSPNGHYVFRLDYIMFGPWMQLLQITPSESETEHKIEVVLVAVP